MIVAPRIRVGREGSGRYVDIQAPFGLPYSNSAAPCRSADAASLPTSCGAGLPCNGARGRAKPATAASTAERRTHPSHLLIINYLLQASAL